MTDENKRQQTEAAHFDHLAEQCGEIWWGSKTPAGIERLKRRAKSVAKHLSNYDSPLVLELGCGTGAFSQYILEEMPDLNLLGIDVSPKSVEVAKERLGAHKNTHFMVGDATSLANDSDSCDAVVGNSVLHHLPLQESINEVFRVLKPGGLLWFSEPNMMNPEIALEKNVGFIGRMTQTSPDETAFFRWPLAKVLKKAGFTRVNITPYDFMHPLVPKPMIRAVDLLGYLLERTPLICELTGSLMIVAIK